ncbi:MAG: hypothetical protein IKB38_02845 [Clostridia bacterium]|nr:hypothetical protein [Clostridia bacterium]
MQNHRESFKYTYSANEQDEIKKIRSKYTCGEESKIERLRRLDKKVSQKSTAYSLIIGIIGALLLGCGMSLVMTEIGAFLALGKTAAVILGIIVGLIGAILVALAYPVYNTVTRKEREKVAPEIIKLTDELLK